MMSRFGWPVARSTTSAVIEMGQLLAGPFGGQFLADFGAEVIKIEPPGEGDPMREWGREHQRPALVAVVARNKKSVTLDLRTPEGQRSRATSSPRPTCSSRTSAGHASSAGGSATRRCRRSTPARDPARHRLRPDRPLRRARPATASIGEAMGGLRYVMGDPDRPPCARRHLHRRHPGRDVRRASADSWRCTPRAHRPRPGGRLGALRGVLGGDGEAGHPNTTHAGYVRERTGRSCRRSRRPTPIPRPTAS